MEKERDIYIKDMLFYIFRKWRMILLWMLVLAVVADGFSALKSYKNVVQSHQEQNSAGTELEALKAELSKDDVKKAEDAYELYETYKKSLDKSMNYYQNSIKMQMDPNNVSTISLQYNISQSKKMKDIVVAYSNNILSEELCQYINEKSGMNSKANYISELITFDINADIDKKDSANNELNIIESTDDASMSVRIISPDKDSCEIIADVIEEKIQEQTSEIQNSLGNFNIKLVDRNYINRVDNDLLKEQQNYVSNLNSIKTAMSNLSTTLSDNQKNYYTALINQEEVNTSSEDMDDTVVFQSINIKYIIVGLIAGAFLAVLWYVVCYVISDRLRVYKEIEEYFGVPVLGSIKIENNENKKKNIIDRVICNFFEKNNSQSETDSMQLITTSILMTAQKNNIKRIHIFGAADSQHAEKIKKDIQDKLQHMDIDLKCSSGKSIIKDVKSLNACSKSEGVVFIEEIAKSDFEEMGKGINLCLKNNIDIIGAVVID